MATLIFFDPAGGELAPMTDLRASYEIRTGVRTTLERWCAWWGGDAKETPEPGGLFCEDGLAGVLRGRWGCTVNDVEMLRGLEDVVLVNGRCVSPPIERDTLEPGCAAVDPESGEIVVARVGGASAAAIIEAGGTARDVKEIEVGKPAHLRDSWDIVRCRNDAVLHDLERMTRKARSEPIPTYVHVIGAKRVVAGKGARIMPGAVLDASEGAIVIGESATIRPGAVITGPAAIGAHSTVLDGAVVRGFTSVGEWCKVNGEIAGSIVQGYSNKAHDGYLGDSYLGEWVNLGAGTITSNLLNTYSEINARATPGSKRKATGLTFLGSIIGDHSKTAIGTMLGTGTVIGTGCMIARTATAPSTLDRFAWMTDAGELTYRFEKFVEVARAAMGRRSMEASDAYIDRLRVLHALRGEQDDGAA